MRHTPPLAPTLVELDAQEAALWQDPFDPERLCTYQAACRAYEAARGTDHPGHAIRVVIPVADRPRHLDACLGSLLDLCRAFGYGGQDDAGNWRKVSVLVADDSAEPESLAAHAALCRHYSAAGLACEHFDPAAQLALLTALDAETRAAIEPILGPLADDPAQFGHKGPSRMRNIAYLRLRQQQRPGTPQLYFFIDSDQEFRIRLAEDGSEPYAVNYLHHLDRLFQAPDLALLTGKVVGDPPVSPAVMAGKLLLDLHATLTALAALDGTAPCTLHPQERHLGDDAGYHDLAQMFGFSEAASGLAYHCPLDGAHDHIACLAHFAAQLDAFHDGAHPTRMTWYSYQSPAASRTPARTLYTGNYVIRAEGLDDFIPFAPLRLRMAGPTLGRLLKASRGPAFASANLPLLHRRTVAELGQAEFRPGVAREAQGVDISDEFERQFFGDVMLFSVERLAAAGYPEVDAAPIDTTLEAVEGELLGHYAQLQAERHTRLDALRALYATPDQWWHGVAALAEARGRIERFLAEMEHNFGRDARGFAYVQDAAHRASRRAQLAEALRAYPDLRRTWRTLLTRLGPCP